MSSDAWNPAQYERFAAERRQPFDDLVSLLRPAPEPRVVDLGCGTGALTAELHKATGARETVGIDSSASMLERAGAHTGDGVRFEQADASSFGGAGDYDIVFSNAALQWMPDHARVVAGWTAALRPGGQLAVQVPANWDHPSHLVSAELAHESPYVDAFDGAPPPDPVRDNVLVPHAYAELLHELGYAEQHVRLQVYGHLLASTSEVVEWVKGTSLTRFQRRLPPELFDRFVADYRTRLLTALGDRSPYFYPFNRILFWARLPA